MLTKAEEYVLEAEESEVENSNLRICEANLNNLLLLLNIFKDSISKNPNQLIEDVDRSKHSQVIHRIISDKKETMNELRKQKFEISSMKAKDKLYEQSKKLDSLFDSTNCLFDSWIESALKLCSTESSISSSNTLTREPKLNLERLSLPVFSGNVREYAKFMKEFECTVGVQFEDPKIKVLYLKNQCLSESPKALVSGLTEYDDVISRLTERYGKPSLTIDCVMHEINDMNLSNIDEQSAIIEICRVIQAAWDDLTAVGYLDEFCNIVTY